MPQDSFATKYILWKLEVGLVLPHWRKSLKLFVIFVVWGILGHYRAKSCLRVCSSRISIRTSWLKLMVEFSRQQAGKVARMVRWGGSRLGDCHGVAPLLPQPLIWPACTGLRAKARDYIQCTSTSTTHCLLAKQHHAVLHLLPLFFFFFETQLQAGCMHASVIFFISCQHIQGDFIVIWNTAFTWGGTKFRTQGSFRPHKK